MAGMEINRKQVWGGVLLCKISSFVCQFMLVGPQQTVV